eukprot:7895224-Pyramimonas_sp.AAC.1
MCIRDRPGANCRPLRALRIPKTPFLGMILNSPGLHSSPSLRTAFPCPQGHTHGPHKGFPEGVGKAYGSRLVQVGGI